MRRGGLVTCASEGCEREAVGQGRYCLPCRAQRRKRPTKYVWTEERERELRAAYADKAAGRLSRALRRLERRWGWPAWALKRRAAALGLATGYKRGLDWSPEEEEAILIECAWMGTSRIRVRLREAGYQRTDTAISVKRKRMGFAAAEREGYSLRQVCDFLGEDHKTVRRWLASGALRGERRGTTRTAAQGGDEWYVQPRDLRDFLRRHPGEYELGRIADKLWFLDLVTDGAVAGGRHESLGVEGSDAVGSPARVEALRLLERYARETGRCGLERPEARELVKLAEVLRRWREDEERRAPQVWAPE